MRTSRFLPFIAILSLVAAGTPSALSAEAEVTLSLSEPVTEVGSPIQLELHVTDGEADEGPPDIKVEGLDIQYVAPSRSTRMQIVNGRMSASVETSYLYQVTASKEGDFTIPAQSLKVDGRAYKTQPVALKVQKGAGNTIGFAELSVEKQTAYVGEIIPVEFKLYIRVGVPAEVGSIPELNGDGFTIQKPQQPEQKEEMREGERYAVVTFKTVMTPTKAGKLVIGPSEIPYIAQVPSNRQRKRRSFGGVLDDDFFNPFGGRFAERRQFKATAKAVELTVKPLPAEGRPKNFSGAVGQFAFDAQGAPTRLKVGDPVTMRLRVSGSGNFDRVTAPTMANATGWQAYDSSEKFEPRDELKTSGVKTFELPLVAETNHRTTPVFEFPYFDPKTAKYVTLRSKPQDLTVEGAPVARAPIPTESVPASQPAPEPNSATPAAVDLAGLRYDSGVVGTFAPIYARRGFWFVQAIPAVALFGIVLARIFRADPRKRRAAILERERAQTWKRVRSSGDATAFWENAARLVQIDTALKHQVEADSVDLTLVQRVRSLDSDTDTSVSNIFERRDALLFAGGGMSRSDVSAEQRAQVIATLEKLCRR